MPLRTNCRSRSEGRSPWAAPADRSQHRTPLARPAEQGAKHLQSKRSRIQQDRRGNDSNTVITAVSSKCPEGTAAPFPRETKWSLSTHSDSLVTSRELTPPAPTCPQSPQAPQNLRLLAERPTNTARLRKEAVLPEPRSLASLIEGNLRQREITRKFRSTVLEKLGQDSNAAQHEPLLFKLKVKLLNPKA